MSIYAISPDSALLPELTAAFKEELADCPICIDTISWWNRTATPLCGHSFHAACLETWAKDHNTCPICRGPLKSRVARLWDYLMGVQPRRAEEAPRPNRRAHRGTRPIHNRR